VIELKLTDAELAALHASASSIKENIGILQFKPESNF
jgi:hypothetical protein